MKVKCKDFKAEIMFNSSIVKIPHKVIYYI